MEDNSNAQKTGVKGIGGERSYISNTGLRTGTSLDMTTQVGGSTPAQPICAICNRHAIYTCPCCRTRTCSLKCSATHKSYSKCTGVRDQAAYVPLNRYGWGTMMDDYVFLEDIGRRVGDWGREIVKGGFGRGIRGAAGRARGRGRGMGRGLVGKRDMLKMQLELRDVEIDLLPVGMERRNLNQSSWDFKRKTVFLTIEFKFYRPPDPLASPSQPQEVPFILLTHRNNINTPLLSLVQSHIKERSRSKKEDALPGWVGCLVCPHPDDPDSFSPPQCVMTAQVDPFSSVALQFVEFPTIEVWEEFRGTVVDAQGRVTHLAEVERKPKRRKLDPKVGKKMIESLVGGYGSEEEDLGVMAAEEKCARGEEEEAEEVEAALDPIALLELMQQVQEPGAEAEDDEDEAEEVEAALDPVALLELMRQVQGEKWMDSTEDDQVDWGDSISLQILSPQIE